MISKKLLAVGISLTLSSIPLFGGSVGHLISLTELSSTNLTATYDGSTAGITVTPGINPDTWTVVLPSSAFILGFAGATWAEPEGPAFGNFVTAIGNNTLSVTSDVPTIAPPLANNASIFTNTFDTQDQLGILIAFHDVQDSAVAVPEPGSTWALLALGLAILVVGRRLGRPRLA